MAWFYTKLYNLLDQWLSLRRDGVFGWKFRSIWERQAHLEPLIFWDGLVQTNTSCFQNRNIFTLNNLWFLFTGNRVQDYKSPFWLWTHDRECEFYRLLKCSKRDFEGYLNNPNLKRYTIGVACFILVEEEKIGGSLIVKVLSLTMNSEAHNS